MRLHRHRWRETFWGSPIALRVRICQRCTRWEVNEGRGWTLFTTERKIAQQRLNDLFARAPWSV